MKLGPIIAAVASGAIVLGIAAVARARGLITMPTGKPGSTPSTPSTPAPTGSSGGVTVRDSVIYGPGGARIPITDTDALWLARAITGEVRESRPREAKLAVAWALAQNLMLVRHRASDPPRYSTFTTMILRYCQPVNPMWRDPNGAKCRQHPANCRPDQIVRRQQYAVMTWDDISDSVRSVVEDFRAGRTTNPVPGMVDWHASTFEGAQRQIGGNHFGTLPFRPMLG